MKSEDRFVLQLFHQASARVPAYKDFLKKQGVNASTIKTIADFKKLPIVDKKNYLSKYSLADLSWDGNLFRSQMISVSSGSTGEPFFWPRGPIQDEEGVWMHERIYRDIFDINNHKTLIVVCFSMGTWIAGSFTTSSSIGVARKSHKMNVVTPGLEQEEALKAVKNLAPLYDQVVLAGYPPFIKDIIDIGKLEGINWKKIKLRFLWAGEAFSEEWRDYVLKSVGIKDPYFHTVNIYGTADAAMVAHETPVSILVRRVYNRREKLTHEVFDNGILPSIVQYYPDRRYFEGLDGEIIFSAYAGLPLVRYNIHDSGGVMEFDELTGPIKETLESQAKKFGVRIEQWNLPFVYLNGRKDFTVTIYAVNIYPENIKAALIDPKMRSWVTGKFTMATKYHSDMDQYFEINIELAKGLEPEPDYQLIARKTIIGKLMKLNAEFHKLHAAVGGKAEPEIHLIKYGDKQYFGNGVKHRWVQKAKK